MGIWKSSKPLDSYIPQLRRLDPAFLEVSHYGTAGAHPSLALRRAGWLYWWLHDFDFYGRCIIEIREKRIAILFVTPTLRTARRMGHSRPGIPSVIKALFRKVGPPTTIMCGEFRTRRRMCGVSCCCCYKGPHAPLKQWSLLATCIPNLASSERGVQLKPGVS